MEKYTMESIHTKELLSKLSNILESFDFSADAEGKYNDDGIKYVIVEDTDWEINYKDYASKDTVFHFPELNVFVRVTENRSGSYYSDYYYDDPQFEFVKPQEITVTSYVSVKAVTNE